MTYSLKFEMHSTQHYTTKYQQTNHLIYIQPIRNVHSPETTNQIIDLINVNANDASHVIGCNSSASFLTPCI